MKEIETLPQFPDNIVNLQRLIADPNAEITDIAREISVDPSMTADLLKLVNSAQFMLPKRVDNIVEAVKLVGTKGVRNLLYSYGTQKVLGEKYSEMRSLWQHSYRCAFYAYYIAKSFKKKKELLDDVYVGGILHDLGQIVIASLHPDLLERITKVCKEKGIPARMLENFSVGLNHAEVGALIAKKWNFPEQLVTAIRFHHEPHAGARGRARHRVLRVPGQRDLRHRARAHRVRPGPDRGPEGLRHRDRGPAQQDPRESWRSLPSPMIFMPTTPLPAAWMRLSTGTTRSGASSMLMPKGLMRA